MSDIADSTTDKELDLLEHISQRDRVRQRDLARAIGMSLGMTNAILKRLARKGYLTIRKVNNRNIAYAITPEGVEAIAKRSYRYLRRTVGNIVRYKEAIESLVRDLHGRGVRIVSLAGKSDLAFIVEHFCLKYGMVFEHRPQQGPADPEDYADVEGHRFTLYAESLAPPPSWATAQSPRRSQPRRQQDPRQGDAQRAAADAATRPAAQPAREERKDVEVSPRAGEPAERLDQHQAYLRELLSIGT